VHVTKGVIMAKQKEEMASIIGNEKIEEKYLARLEKENLIPIVIQLHGRLKQLEVELQQTELIKEQLNKELLETKLQRDSAILYIEQQHQQPHSSLMVAFTQFRPTEQERKYDMRPQISHSIEQDEKAVLERISRLALASSR